MHVIMMRQVLRVIAGLLSYGYGFRGFLLSELDFEAQYITIFYSIGQKKKCWIELFCRLEIGKHYVFLFIFYFPPWVVDKQIDIIAPPKIDSLDHLQQMSWKHSITIQSISGLWLVMGGKWWWLADGGVGNVFMIKSRGIWLASFSSHLIYYLH